MSGDRWSVLGLAAARAPWFSAVTRWATSASIPVDFVKCVSAPELRARLTGGRPFSAVLVGANAPGLDRDLVATALELGVTTIVVGTGPAREWADLGVAAVLPGDFERDDLIATLRVHADPIARFDTTIEGPRNVVGTSWAGRLVAVTGAGGTGVSITAMALAQQAAADASNRNLVLLADFALQADQAVLHDAREVVPGVQELMDAHRAGHLPIDEVRSLAFSVEDRGYHVLLGLRRRRDWTALRQRAFQAGLEGLLRSYRLVVADVDTDLDGQSETGSMDIEDRNLMSRTTLRLADVVVVVGAESMVGMHGLTRTVREIVGFGVDARRIQPVIGCAPRSRRRRAASTSVLASLLDGDDMSDLANPVFVSRRPDVETAIRDGCPLPNRLGRAVHAEVRRRLAHSPREQAVAESVMGSPIMPGTLGTWTGNVG